MSDPPSEASDLYRAAPGDPLGGLVRHHVYVPDVDAMRLLGLIRHFDELVREFTLIRLGRRSGITSADYPYRLLEIIDEIVSTYSASRHDMRRQAVEAVVRGEATFTLHAMSAVEAAPMASRLGELLDEVRRFCSRGDLLALPVSDEQAQFHRSFYRRLASHVHDADDPVPVEDYGAFIASMAVERGAPAPMPGGARMIELPFEAELAAPRVIRRLIRETLEGWGRPDLPPEVALPATELISNAVLHTRRPGRFVMLLSDALVRIEVHDLGGTAVERVPGADSEASTGYGLVLVEAMTSRWGTQPGDAGKVVWFEIDLLAERTSDHAAQRVS
ncbi:MAG TPA: ATP-binding protein [Egibacteraceae bacterium]|nr:ATP-binding protein [Egibacteraceae bacterium]